MKDEWKGIFFILPPSSFLVCVPRKKYCRFASRNVFWMSGRCESGIHSTNVFETRSLRPDQKEPVMPNQVLSTREIRSPLCRGDFGRWRSCLRRVRRRRLAVCPVDSPLDCRRSPQGSDARGRGAEGNRSRSLDPSLSLPPRVPQRRHPGPRDPIAADRDSPTCFCRKWRRCRFARECVPRAPKEAFTEGVEEVRSATETSLDQALDLLLLLLRLPHAIDPRVIREILSRFFEESDRSRFALMNAVTSVARETRVSRAALASGRVGGRNPGQPSDASRQPESRHDLPRMGSWSRSDK